MATWLQEAGIATGISQNASLARFYSFAGPLRAGQTDETRAQILVRAAYTWANMYIRCPFNGILAASTIFSRIDTVNGNQTVSIPASTSGVFEDNVRTDALVSGNLIDFVVNSGAGGGPIQFTVMASTLAASTMAPILVTQSSDGQAPSNEKYCIGGWAAPAILDEPFHQYVFRVAITFSNFRVFVNANTLNGATTYRLRKNSLNGNESISVGAGLTGGFEDAVNTDIIAIGNNANLGELAGGALGSIQEYIDQLKETCNSAHLIVGRQDSPLSQGLTRHVVCSGDLQYTATEANAGVACRTPFSAKNLFVRAIANTLTVATTVTVRKTAVADTALTLSIPNATTGTFENTADTVALLAADVIHDKVVTAAGAGSITLVYIGFEGQPTGGVVAPKGGAMANKMVAAGCI